MAINPTAPGVYIQEISTLPPSVAPVATAIPAFIGYTEKAIIDGVAWTYPSSAPAPAVRITSMVEFESIFGGAFSEKFEIGITGTFPAITMTTVTPKSTVGNTISDYILYYHMQMYFANGGGPCYVISVAKYPTTATTITAAELIAGVNKAEEVDEVTLLVVPEAMKAASKNTVFQRMLDQCEKLEDRFAILDVEVDTGNPVTDAGNFRSADIPGVSNLKYGAAYYPSLKTQIDLAIKDSSVLMENNAITQYDGLSISVLLTGVNANIQLYNDIKAKLAMQYNALTLYPSGAMAGIYAAVDRTRGVWKAPANVSLNYVTAPSVIMTEDDNGSLNIDATAGKSINAIRQFVGKGTLVWGARTLAGNDNEWRYVNVRRFFNYAEESIKKATEAVVFEPNDANTWLRVKGTITNFLTNEWRNGALVGAKPEHAFFVKVGLNETMSAQDILEGKLIIQIGMAVSRPAEFIILQFMHKLQEA